MEFSLTAVMLICSTLSGALSLALGAAISYWILRKQAAISPDRSAEGEHVASMLQGLSQWTGSFSSEISAYRNVLNSLEQRVRSEFEQRPSQPGEEQGVFSEIAQANDLLKNRLNTAEATLRKQAEEIAGYLSEARTDVLTQLPNRRAFDAESARRFAEWKRYGRPFSVVLVDVDHFKLLNDRHGHLAGDMVLREVGAVLRSVLRDTDFPARFGGEEFSLLFPSLNVGDAGVAAERIREAIERVRFNYEGKVLEVTVSCGAAQALQHEDATELFKRADQALYASKRHGRNCTHWHDGKRCVLVTQGSDQLAAGGGAIVSSDLQAVCIDLRKRLIEVTSQEIGEAKK